MHELAEVWTDRKGLSWIAVTALLYAFVLITFNQYHVDIAGISLRPAAALPVVFGILWGPAAAWGLGIGNVAGDFFGGSWSPMSIFGFLINFLYPYLSYLLWHRLMRGHGIRMDAYGLGGFWVVTMVTTLACMLFLAACGTIFFGRPFESKFISYFGNSITWAMVAGPILFCLLAGPAFQNRLVYGREWKNQEKVPVPQKT
jgi:energy-coupling factor transport system substrate-specific component